MTFGSLFSVVIPTYNHGHKVKRAVESVLAQTFKDYEIWVVDDGSTDGTLKTLRPLYFGHVGFNYSRHGCNQGVAEARNDGIQQSKGRYVAFLDADDWWYPHKLERVAEAIKHNPDVGLFYSRTDFCDEDESVLWNYRSQNGDYRALLETDFVMTCAAVVKRVAFTCLGGFDGDLTPCEDWDMWIRIAREFPIKLIPETLAAHEHMGAAGLTSDYHRWASQHYRVVNRALSAAPLLDAGARRRIQSAVEYRRGKIYLEGGDEGLALAAFRYSMRIRRGNWKSWVCWLLLRYPWLQGMVPRRLRWR